MQNNNRFRVRVVVAALASAFAPGAMAADDEDAELIELTKPTSEVSAGVGYATQGSARFGQYNGIKDAGAYPLLDFDIRHRDDATGTWATLRGRNLGLDDRDVRGEYGRQGNWNSFLEYSQTPRYEPFKAITGLSGIGSNNQGINGTGLRPVELKMQRDAFSLGVDKFIAGGWEFQLRFKNEEKNGARLWGQGDNPFPAAVQQTRFLTDPIDYTTRQWEAIANYTAQKLQLTMGYYGTQFENHNSALTVTGTPAPIFNTMSLPPGNQSHQLYVGGGYNITQTARTNFKLAYTYTAQNEPFIAAIASGRHDLGGRVMTLLGTVGFTAQPLPKLSVLANLRYEDHDDNTPLAQYFTGVTPTSTLDGTNEPRSVKTIYGKTEATYRLPMGFRLLGGIDYEEVHRSLFRVRVVSFRDRTEELSARTELRRTIGESVTGSIGYVHGERGGSPFLTTVLNNNSAVGASNFIAPLYLSDRTRDKIRATLTWMATDPLTFQFSVDEGVDHYKSRTFDQFGVRKGRSKLYSADATYQISEKWQANLWYTMDGMRQDQATQFVGPPTTNWLANNANDSNTLGVGVHGKPTTKLDLGADILYSKLNDKFGISTLGGAAAVSDIPQIHTRMTRMTLTAKYAIDKNMGVRFNYIFDRWSSDDWTWSQFVYTDGTRLTQDPSQKVHFLGITGYYRFH